jgi:hypothetical protein
VSRAAALFLALSFPLNSYELRFANLHLNSDMLLPFTVAAFAWLAQSVAGGARWSRSR